VGAKFEHRQARDNMDQMRKMTILSIQWVCIILRGLLDHVNQMISLLATNKQTRGVSITLCVALPFTLLNCVLMKKKKNYENSNISPCKNNNLQKNPLKETKILPDIMKLYN
jgi:hypothetical protein